MLNKHNRYVKRLYIDCAFMRSYFPHLVQPNNLFTQNSLVCSNSVRLIKNIVKINQNNYKMYLQCVSLYFYHFRKIKKKQSDVQHIVLMFVKHRSFSLHLHNMYFVQKNKQFTVVRFTPAFYLVHNERFIFTFNIW